MVKSVKNSSNNKQTKGVKMRNSKLKQGDKKKSTKSPARASGKSVWNGEDGVKQKQGKRLPNSMIKNKDNKARFRKGRKESPADSDMSEDDTFTEVSQTVHNFKAQSSDVTDEAFPSVSGLETEEQQTRKLVMQQNRKNKKSGGFQSMGLSHSTFKGIMKKGYKIPTPIQRKTIPLILDHKDVVAMARTGSGKTAAFLIPMLEHLKAHSTSGARALILSPTRELALQTFKFTKELGKFNGLKPTLILGGDRLEDQFTALHENPDILIATPGRFMHVLVEMELRLSAVEYVVFDEADRLFEMGFAEQLREISARLPDSRQTLLFSATLPGQLVEFARAGLNDPTLVRLDVDTKLSEQLGLSFLQCRSEDKTALLLYLLRCVMKPSQQTLVFAATKHHVEYLNMILTEADIISTYVYSSLDPTARKINIAKFQRKRCRVMIVTDLAARGIDIPMLDNVINYNFPAKPKLFVHRVGRVARAGRSGVAYSIVSQEELSYVIDLHLFLGRSLNYANPQTKADEYGIYGRVPQNIIDDEDQKLRVWKTKTDVLNMEQVISNAYKQYARSRPSPSPESVKRAKNFSLLDIAIHPMFGQVGARDQARNVLLDGMRSYRPNNTIFEVNANKKTEGVGVMKKKRDLHTGTISANIKKTEDVKQELMEKSHQVPVANDATSTEEQINEVFSSVVAPKKRAFDKPYEVRKKRKKENTGRDEEHYVAYQPKNNMSEKGLSLGTSFEKEVAGAMMDIIGDENQQARTMDNHQKWDRKKKKFVGSGNDTQKTKRVKTESGHWIPASYKTNLYKEWLEKNKTEKADSDNEDNVPQKHRGSKFARRRQAKLAGQQKQQKGSRSELKRPEQILKRRKEKAKKENFQRKREQAHNKGGGRGGGRGGGGGGRGRGGGVRVGGGGRGGGGGGRGRGGRSGGGGGRGVGGGKRRK